MATEERRISPAVIVIPFALGLGALGVIALIALAGGGEEPEPPPPGKATLYGVVTDSQTGQPLAGVLVTLNSYQTETDAQGRFLFENLELGDYSIRFDKEGYVTVIM